MCRPRLVAILALLATSACTTLLWDLESDPRSGAADAGTFVDGSLHVDGAGVEGGTDADRALPLTAYGSVSDAQRTTLAEHTFAAPLGAEWAVIAGQATVSDGGLVLSGRPGAVRVDLGWAATDDIEIELTAVVADGKIAVIWRQQDQQSDDVYFSPPDGTVRYERFRGAKTVFSGSFVRTTKSVKLTLRTIGGTLIVFAGEQLVLSEDAAPSLAVRHIELRGDASGDVRIDDLRVSTITR